MKLPIISVIVPVYNVENYLSNCIDSIINQTYKNLEIILVDDGSTDTSGLICDEYAKADARIKVLHKENGGVSSARNLGIDVATGDLISFVDSDDCISHNMLASLHKNLVEQTADISICNYECFEKFSNINLHTKCTASQKIHLSDTETIQFFGNNEIAPANAIWGKLYKKELFIDIKFPDLTIAEDLVVSFKLFHKSKKVFATNEKNYKYRIRSGSVVHSKKLTTSETMIACDIIQKYCNEKILDKEYDMCKEIILKIKLNTILDNYFIAYRRKLDKSVLLQHRELYNEIKTEVKQRGLMTTKAKLFELNPKLFLIAMWCFAKKHNLEKEMV